MKKIINPQIAIFAVGVLQPTSAREVRGFLRSVLAEGGQVPPIREFADLLDVQRREGRLVRVLSEDDSYYSLSLRGTHYLTPALRKSRDKFRMYLLRDSHRVRMIESRAVSDEELVGVSPTVDTRSSVKGHAANKLGRSAFGRRFANGQPYWPRTQGQFVRKTGPSRTARDTFPNLLSFVSKEQAIEASFPDFRFDYVGIGVCLSVSSQMIWKMATSPDRYYRSFALRKRGGGERIIESPRIFLKVVQWFLSDFVLDDLRVHERVHSFTIGKSILTNASLHERRAYVGTVDIEDFFGSIKREAVKSCLVNQGFDEIEAEVISSLCTKQDHLPQGAPTSPIIANSVLFEFDELISQLCQRNGLVFSRYADDITISGNDRSEVVGALERAGAVLEGRFGLRLNPDKTRIASRGGQQRVTGVVVNEQAVPPRRFRRKVRAIFHHASREPERYIERIAELGGYLGYLGIFPKLIDSDDLAQYVAVLRGLRQVTGNLRGQRPARA